MMKKFNLTQKKQLFTMYKIKILKKLILIKQLFPITIRKRRGNYFLPQTLIFGSLSLQSKLYTFVISNYKLDHHCKEIKLKM